MAIAGKVAITPKGEWNANTAYTKLDLVFYDNASYVAIQPSTGVEPTNTSYWMLVVQSAGGADLEAIINGTTQVGNAKTLDGHVAEYFFPNTGGTINGDVWLYKESDTLLYMMLKNALRQINLEVQKGGAFRLRDTTNSKDIINSTVDGTNTFNGTASGNVKLDGGGTVKNASWNPMSIKNTASDTVHMGFSGLNGTQGYLGFAGGKPSYCKSDGNTLYELLHTGNKPTGTYTGNGDSTTRTINIGGVGNMLFIRRAGSGAVVYPFGATTLTDTGNASATFKKTEACFENGVLTLNTASGIVNGSGVTYTYEVK